jgi:hypothetical protein
MLLHSMNHTDRVTAEVQQVQQNCPQPDGATCLHQGTGLSRALPASLARLGFERALRAAGARASCLRALAGAAEAPACFGAAALRARCGRDSLRTSTAARARTAVGSTATSFKTPLPPALSMADASVCLDRRAGRVAAALPLEGSTRTVAVSVSAMRWARRSRTGAARAAMASGSPSSAT